MVSGKTLEWSGTKDAIISFTKTISGYTIANNELKPASSCALEREDLACIHAGMLTQGGKEVKSVAWAQ